jgi:hypothetical protein
MLTIEPNTSCESADYPAWTYFATAMIVVYPVGVPLACWLLLLRVRGKISPKEEHGCLFVEDQLHLRHKDKSLVTVCSTSCCACFSLFQGEKRKP